MKHLSYPIFFTSIILLALVMLTSGCSQSVMHKATPGDDTSKTSQRSAGDTQIFMLPGDVPLEMVWIPPGSFMMGSPEDEQDRSDNEGPQHEVTFTSGFWMSKYEITQAQWLVIMGNNPARFNKGENRPVEIVSWDDIRGSGGYLEQLNATHPGYNFRLPSEAEWEYAYRAGTTTRFYWGDDPDYTELEDYAWFFNNSSHSTHDVGLKLPNAWGLHDMAGNVKEWCEDDWHDNYHGAPIDGSAWVDSPRDTWRLLRGGGADYDRDYCRAAGRSENPVSHGNFGGFRVVFASD